MAAPPPSKKPRLAQLTLFGAWTSFTVNGERGQERLAPPPSPRLCPHCGRQLKTPTALRLHLTYCSKAPANAESLHRAEADAALFASLFENVHVVAETVEDGDNSSDRDDEDDALVEPDGGHEAREATDAMVLDAVVAKPVIQRKSYSVKEKMLIIIARRRQRRCLPECVCEKPRGRKCHCELVGDGQCGEGCGCDKAKCRAWAPAAEDS